MILTYERNTSEMEILNIEHNRIVESFNDLLMILDEQYQLAISYLGDQQKYGPRYSVNLGLVHSIMSSIDGLIKLIQIFKSNQPDEGQESSAYLMEEQNRSLLYKPAQEQEQQADLETYISKQKYSNQITLGKNLLNYRVLQKIETECKNLYSIKLNSDPFDQRNQINDEDLQKLTSLTNISILSLRDSSITDSGIETLKDKLPHIKQIDLTGCYMLTERGIKVLSECGLVTIKLSNMTSIKQDSILELIRYATNLNYLQITGCSTITQSISFQIFALYRQHSSTLKWLEITSDFGIDLYINKLTYLTSENPVQEITDTDFKTLIGEQPPQYTGIYFENCQELTKSSIQIMIQKCTKIKRLALSKYVNLTDRLVQDITLALTELSFLDLNSCFNITDNSLYYVAQNLSIEYLVLEKCYSITDQGLINIFNHDNQIHRNSIRDRKRTKSKQIHIKNGIHSNLNRNWLKLRYLNIANCKKITDLAIQLLCQNAQGLTYLNLSNCDQISDRSIQIISQSLLQLQYLNLNHCEGLTDSSVSMLATRLGMKLKVLQIQWCQISQHCIRLIVENLTNLRILNISYCPSVLSQEIELVAKNIPKIHTLKLQSCNKINEKAFIKLSSLRELKIVCIKQCTEVNDIFIKLLTTNNRNLQELDISWCRQVTDNSLLSIAKNCYVIRYLNLNGCVKITDQGIEWLCTTVSELEYLNITLCSQLTDHAIIQITSKLRTLKHLYMCELHQVTDVSISTIANLDKLEQLVLLGCIRITSSSLVGLMYNLERLYEFNIGQCRSVQGKSLSKMCPFMTNIKILEISEIQVDDYFLEELARYCPKLTYINLCYCNDISDSAILKLLENLPRLERIHIQNTNITERTQAILFHALNARRMDNVVLE